MELKFKKEEPLAITPTKGSKYSAGMDLYAATDETINILPHTTIMISTGLSMEIPEGYFGAIFARSGIASKRGLRPANSVGVVDADYRGVVKVALHNDTETVQQVAPQERIAQLVIMPFLPVDLIETKELSETDRGTGGFGSTGK